MEQSILSWLFWRTVFFSSLVRDLNERFPNLFQKDSQEGIQEGAESSEESRTDRTDDSDTENSFGNKWQWINWISLVSKELGVSWFEVYKIQAMVFLNVICFLIDKSNEEKRQIEQWKRKH